MDFSQEPNLPRFSRFQALGLLFLAIFSILAIARPAQAGILSVFVNLFNPNALAEENLPVGNSQTMALLESALNLDPNPNKGVGDITVVSGNAFLAETGPVGTIADVEIPKNDQVSIYTVHPGDTLTGIAKMFDVSPNTIIWANDLKRGAVLKTGQTLVILPVSGLRYTVKKGDTLAGIAKSFRSDRKEIAEFNGLESDRDLVIGEQIIIPGGELVNTAIRQNYAPGGKWSGPDTSGLFQRPVNGCVRTQGIHPQNAVDLGCPVGTTLRAAAGGRVIVATASGWNGGYGKYIVIQHAGGIQTLYGHLSQVNVGVGETVNQGEVIGATGNSGNSTGPHVHFEVRGARNPF